MHYGERRKRYKLLRCVRIDRGFHRMRSGTTDAARLAVVITSDDPTIPLTGQIIGAAITVHREVGPGLLESAYQACLEYELSHQNLRFRSQVLVPIVYRGVRVDRGYRVDLVVEDCVILEVKAVETLTPISAAQLITYLKLTGCPVGLLPNFNVTSMRQGIRRFTNRPAVDPPACPI